MARLSAAQICALARQVAKVPGFTTQSGEFLNTVLGDLCQTYDLELAAGFVTGNFNPGLRSLMTNTSNLYGSGPYVLPADFLRVKGEGGDMSAWWELLGVKYPLIPCSLTEFDMMVQQAGTQSYPYIMATDMSLGDETQEGQSTPMAYFYAPPSGAFPVTVRYYAQMPDISTPQTSSVVPWFPHQGFLKKKLAAALMEITDDSRQPEFDSEADYILRRYLMLKDNRTNRASTVKLDRRRFGRAYSTLPNTKTVGW